MGTLLTIILTSIIVPICLSFVARDAYSCLPRLQKSLMKIAARILPEEKRDEAVEQWSADISDLLPSELTRTFVAADLIRGAFVMRGQQSLEQFAALRRVHRMIRHLTKNNAVLKSRAAAVYEKASLARQDDETKFAQSEATAVLSAIENVEKELQMCRSVLSGSDLSFRERTLNFIARYV